MVLACADTDVVLVDNGTMNERRGKKIPYTKKDICRF